MTMTNFAAKKAKIQREMDKLQKQIEQLEQRNRKPAIASILRTMREFDITPEEITQAFAKGKPGRAASPRTATKRAPVPPKYRHPDSGMTWTGRGRTPIWLVNEEKAGRTREEFLIEEPTAAPV